MSDSTAKTLFVGALSGIYADMITHPVCTAKARLMVQGAGKGSKVEVQQYRGLIHCMQSLVQKEGIKGLYPGIGAVAVGAAPAQALFFTGMEGTKTLLGTHAGVNFLSGIVAQICGSVAWVPMEVVKEKLMIQSQMKTNTQYSGSFQLVKQVISTEGIRGIYRGFVLQQLTYGPFNGIALMFYNEFKKFLPSGDVYNFICSMSGYAISAALTNPFDVIKTRRQVQMSNPEVFNYKNGFDCFQQIMKNEGISALFAGVTGRMCWLTPRCALAITSYEFFSKNITFFDKKQQNTQFA